MSKKLLKYVRHPVPGRAHVKHITIFGGKLPGTTARALIFFQHRYPETRFCQKTGSGKASKPRTNYNNIFTHNKGLVTPKNACKGILFSVELETFHKFFAKIRCIFRPLMLNIYARKSHWKWYLAAAGVAIVIISLLYTKYLADRLAERENQQAEQFAEAIRLITSVGADTLIDYCDLTLHSKIINQNNTIPVVLLDEAGRIEAYRNIDDRNLDEMDTALVRRALIRMVASGADTIEIVEPPHFSKKLIYTHSSLLSLLNWYPYIQLVLIAAFIGFGYMGFSAARRAEENLVWLGMAKETAHQLGTPITAILGWIETLRSVNEDNELNQEMLTELRTDVTRLELVADRFSKIGAKPELVPVNLYEQLDICRDYMQRRAPRRVVFDFPAVEDHAPIFVRINAPLFDWVVENLLRNAIDAMEEGVGAITAHVYIEGHWACVDISDTGKGIPPKRFKTVFKPGYSTKIRGWGLGLSLSKRIIDQYHGGRIFVKRSESNKGTTFTIQLPKG